jgi:hypothetical protein
MKQNKRVVVLPKDRVDPYKIGPPYLANKEEYFKLLVSIQATNSLVKTIVNNYYPKQRRQLLKHLKSKVSRLRYHCDTFLRTYKEVEK